MNIKLAKVNGFAPAQIMLGFEPQPLMVSIINVTKPKNPSSANSHRYLHREIPKSEPLLIDVWCLIGDT